MVLDIGVWVRGGIGEGEEGGEEGKGKTGVLDGSGESVPPKLGFCSVLGEVKMVASSYLAAVRGVLGMEMGMGWG